MKVCVLVSDDEESNFILKEVDIPRHPDQFFATDTKHSFETVHVRKTSAANQIAELARAKQFDVYLNLCEACFYDDRAGVEVAEALHQLNMPYTGATPIFYQLTKQAMKMAAHGDEIVRIPDHVFAFDDDDIEYAATHLSMPLIVKHYNGHDSVGMTENSKADNVDQMRSEAQRIIQEFGGALIEQFIDGPEYTVLVLANPKDSKDPIALHPVEFKFPANETFKHFDVKWKADDVINNTGETSNCWLPVTDKDLIERLQKASKNIFTACNGCSYGRCDFRIDTATNEPYFLEINANCSIFYPPGKFGSADFIIKYDPMWNHCSVMDLLFENALVDQQKRTKKTRTFFEPSKGFIEQAVQDIKAGGVVQCFEEKASYLVSTHYVQKNWDQCKQERLKKVGLSFTPNVFSTWSEDANKWQTFRHSSEANTFWDGMSVVAKVDINKGDEVTLDKESFNEMNSREYECK